MLPVGVPSRALGYATISMRGANLDESTSIGRVKIGAMRDW
jgi:hypothetical protein